MSFFRLLFRMSILLAASSLARGTGPSATGVVPHCLAECVDSAIHQSVCTTGNQTCFCTSAELRKEVQNCGGRRCPIYDVMAWSNATYSACEIPIRDQSQVIKTVNTILAVGAGVFIIMRFSFKFYARLQLGWDDWTIAMSMVFSSIYVSLVNHGLVPHGLGKDTWTLRPQELGSFAFYLYMCPTFYFVALVLVRHALFIFYLNIFPSREAQILLKASACFNICHAVALVSSVIFQCWPVQYVWEQWTGSTDGTCINVNAATWSGSILGILIDVWMLSIPLWQLRRLQLHWKKKVSVAIMFCIGSFVTIISIIRLRALIHFGNSMNPTWDSYDVSLWSAVELCVGTICTCLPTVRLVLVRFFPYVGSSHERQRDVDRITSSHQVRTLNQSRHTNMITAGQPPVDGEINSSGKGILMERSFLVNHSSDEVSLMYEMPERSKDQRSS